MKRIEGETAKDRRKESNKSTKSVGEEGQENDRISQHESKGDRIGLGSEVGYTGRERISQGVYTRVFRIGGRTAAV